MITHCKTCGSNIVDKCEYCDFKVTAGGEIEAFELVTRMYYPELDLDNGEIHEHLYEEFLNMYGQRGPHESMRNTVLLAIKKIATYLYTMGFIDDEFVRKYYLEHHIVFKCNECGERVATFQNPNTECISCSVVLCRSCRNWRNGSVYCFYCHEQLDCEENDDNE
jgi:hypothetical protein